MKKTKKGDVTLRDNIRRTTQTSVHYPSCKRNGNNEIDFMRGRRALSNKKIGNVKVISDNEGTQKSTSLHDKEDDTTKHRLLGHLILSR